MARRQLSKRDVLQTAKFASTPRKAHRQSACPHKAVGILAGAWRIANDKAREMGWIV
jgi:hypothetical protein